MAGPGCVNSYVIPDLESKLGTKRYQVFVSSTFRDLKNERDRILRTLAESNYIAAGMEFFPAIDQEQFNFIKTAIDESDYYVAVVAGMYGSLASDGLSYSEKEYEYALEKGLPVIALIRENIDSLEPGKREATLETTAMLDRFRNRLSTGRLVAYWKDETELCLRLVHSLARTSKTYPRDGWIKGGEDPETLLRRILELEDANKKLESEIVSLRDASVVDRIRDKLAQRTVRVQFRYTGPADADVNAMEDFTGLETAMFILPRLGFTKPNERHQVTDRELLSAVQSLVARRTKKNEVSVSNETVREIGDMLAGFGLVNLSAYPDGGTQFVMVTAPGFGLVQDELRQMFQQRREEIEQVTPGKVLRDIGSLLSGMLSRRKQ